MNKKIKILFYTWLILLIFILILYLTPIIINFIINNFVEGLTGRWLGKSNINIVDIKIQKILNMVIYSMLIPEVILSIILLINKLKTINKYKKSKV